VAKEALQLNLRKIVIKGVDSFGEKQMLFENGVLTVKNCFSLMEMNTMERKYFENIEIEQFLMNVSLDVFSVSLKLFSKTFFLEFEIGRGSDVKRIKRKDRS
jgi:hypothetical protein